MNDYIYLYEDEAEVEEILNILSKNKDKIQIANEIILQTGKILPMFSLQFNQYYMYDRNICYKNCKYIYKNFYLNKQYLNKEDLSIHIFNIIIKCCCIQKDFINNICINIYKPIYLNNIQIKRLYYILYIIYYILYIIYYILYIIYYILYIKIYHK